MLSTEERSPQPIIAPDPAAAGWSLFGVMVVLDTELAEHSARSASLARRLSDRVGLDCEPEVLAAFLLHDVGTLELPWSVLGKTGTLTPSERGMVGRHSESSAELLETVAGPEAAAIARHHHERYDGTGHPAGLAGTDIPAASRVLAVADTFAALVSRRPHRPAYDPSEALSVVAEVSGTQLDPALVSALLQMADDEPHLVRRIRHRDPTPDVRSLTERASDLSPTQLQTLFAAAIGLDPEEAARRCGRSAGTHRNWVSSVRRSLGCPARRPLPKLLAGIGRDFYARRAL